ncbi:acyltransferase family protein [Flavobacterium flavipallidum]|uniref:Acyltransferase n=1 Tax=Flavobacterium flavipallidum TaxID=3139140 RepID=A0ABU9HJB4_9FLAO
MRIKQLTFTRFIAAICIVIFHYGSGCYLFNNEYSSFIFKQANIGVSYFFILSGFVMIIAYNNRKQIFFFEYFKNRLARIYPVYLLAILLILGIKLFRDVNYIDLILNVLMLQSWIPDKGLTINYPGWSLSVELFFYITFPFLFNYIYKKISLKNIGICIVLFWLFSQIIFNISVGTDLMKPFMYSIKDLHYNPLLHFNEFLIGNLTGLYFVNKLNMKKKNYLGYILFTFLVLFLVLRFSFGINYHNGLLSVVFVPLILLISLSTDRLTNLFTKDIFIFLGEISFGIYILQMPVWIIFSDYRMNKYFGLDKESDFSISFFIRVGILFLIATISYLYFEKPIRDKINNSQLVK